MDLQLKQYLCLAQAPVLQVTKSLSGRTAQGRAPRSGLNAVR